MAHPSSAATAPTAGSTRLLALDALRGATIAGMIVVNTPGSWSAVFPPLLHASWHGLTPADLVFPFFLFIVGVSIALSFRRQLASGASAPELHRKILWRAVKIFAVGVFLNLWPDFAVGDIRFAGVLQRIALVFGATGILFLHLRWRGLLGASFMLLLGYWALLSWVPVPRDAVAERALETGLVERSHGAQVPVAVTALNERALAPNLEPGTNLAAWFDREFLPGGMWERTWDPEGWLSTLPSIATALLGVLTGLFLLHTPALRRRVMGSLGAGLVLLLIGWAWSTVFPLNKNLWTSSFVLVSAGWSLVLLALFIVVIDGSGWRRPAFPFLVFGSNPIAAYTLAGMLTVVFVRPWIGGTSVAQAVMRAGAAVGAPAPLASLCFALLYTAVIFIPIYMLHRRRIFLRL
jgi:predicted acyltransferase